MARRAKDTTLYRWGEGLHPWAGNFYMLGVQQKKKKKKKKKLEA